MKISIKSINSVMSVLVLLGKTVFWGGFFALEPFSSCMFFHSVYHYVLFQVVTVITKQSFGFSIICL